MKLSRKVIDILCVVLTLAGMGAASLRFSPAAEAISYKLTGQAPNCSLASLLRMKEDNLGHERLAQQFKAASHVVLTDGDIQLWDTPRGRYWISKRDADLISFLLAEQERRIYGSGRTGVRKGDVVLDCGAHVGVFSKEALREGAGKVIAIEPSPVNLECLRRNLAEEIAAGRAVVYPKGVWDNETALSFRVSSGNSGHDMVVLEGEEADLKIPVTTIDRLVAELGLERVDFIKMDIEGAERHALVGAKRTIARFRPRMALSTYHLPDDPLKIPEHVRSARKDYNIECGPCGLDKGVFTPETYLFW